jgi:4-carboxymuconolactone decarboxylase
VPESSPRIGPLPREQWTDRVREVFAIAEGPKAAEHGPRSNVVLTLATHPELAAHFLAFSVYLRKQSTLPARLRELVILRVAWRYQCDYEWAHHVNLAGHAGVTPAECEAVRDGPDAGAWSELDRLALQATDQLCGQGRIDGATWDALAAHVDKHLLLDLIFTVGGYATLAWALNSLGVEAGDAHLSQGLSAAAV